ncbi:hypothetical protein C8J56DRAFT_1139542 [Mycena floridula]|nr:hypothetical protein C8J56DRAFT_1139542 [Mycena floridula]
MNARIPIQLFGYRPDATRLSFWEKYIVWLQNLATFLPVPQKMSDNCKICGFSATAEPAFSSFLSPPHIQELLATNNPPSQIQESQLRDDVAQTIASLQDLNVKIASMQRDFQQLVRERDQKAAKLKDFKTVLHPIRRFPKEILCEIFLFFINEDLEQDEHVSSLDPSAPHWVVARISAAWRKIATSFARMWSTIRIINRIAISPSLQVSEGISTSHPLLSILFSSSLRWKDLHLDMVITDLDAFSYLRGSFPLLKTLHVWNHDAAGRPQTLNMFEFAPSLTTLWGHSTALSRFNLPFSQITSFQCPIGCECPSYARLLGMMPNLQRLETLCFPDPADPDDYLISPSVLLPHPQRATFRHDKEPSHSGIDCPLLARLSLPALVDLDTVIEKSTEELLALLTRSQCRLTRLSLELHNVPDEDCINLLRDIPSLTSFTLSCSEAQVDKFMDALIRSPLVASGLQSLTMTNQWGLIPAALAQLRASRPSLAMNPVECQKAAKPRRPKILWRIWQSFNELYALCWSKEAVARPLQASGQNTSSDCRISRTSSQRISGSCKVYDYSADPSGTFGIVVPLSTSVDSSYPRRDWL